MNCNPLTKTSVIVASSNLAELLQRTCVVGCRRVVFVTSSRRKILVIINGELRLWFPGSSMRVVLGGKKGLAWAAYSARVMHGVSGHDVLRVGLT